MYEYLCGHYKLDPSIGIDWVIAITIWCMSNPFPKSRLHFEKDAKLSMEYDCHKSNHWTNDQLSRSNNNIDDKFNSNYKNILLIGGFFKQILKDSKINGNLYSIDGLFKIIEKYYTRNLFLQCDEYDLSTPVDNNINTSQITHGWSNFVISEINVTTNFNIKFIRAQTRYNSNLIHFIGMVGIKKKANENLNEKSFLDEVNFKYVNSFGLDMKLDFENKDDKHGNFDTFLKLWLSVFCDIHSKFGSSDDLVYSMLVSTKQNTFVTRSTNVKNINERAVIVNPNDHITMFFENSNQHGLQLDDENSGLLKFYISTGDCINKNGDNEEYYLDCLQLNEKYQYSIVVGYQSHTQIQSLHNGKSSKIGIDLVIDC